MTSKSYEKESLRLVEWYDSHQIIPVFQTGTVTQQRRARELLYNQVGLPPIALRDTSVVEVGPGTGQNAVHLSTFGLKELNLVEPSWAGCKYCEEMKERGIFHCDTNVYQGSIEQFVRHSDRTFDLVICEGLVGSSGYEKPAALVKLLAQCVGNSGSLVLTGEDEIGYLSETLRRFWANRVLLKDRSNFSLDENIEYLKPFFAPHFEKFSGLYKRDTKDWIADVLISPALNYPFFSIAEIVTTLKSEFRAIGTSPRICSDITYYKVAAAEDEFENESLIRAYKNNIVNFLDYRNPPVNIPSIEQEKIENLCKEITTIVQEGNRDFEKCKLEITNLLEHLRDVIQGRLDLTACALDEWIEIISLGIDGVEKFQSKKVLGSWFGRCQTYIHLVRK